MFKATELQVCVSRLMMPAVLIMIDQNCNSGLYRMFDLQSIASCHWSYNCLWTPVQPGKCCYKLCKQCASCFAAQGHTSQVLENLSYMAGCLWFLTCKQSIFIGLVDSSGMCN